jgi:MFS family permease
MMVPVGRLVVLRTVPKSELVRAWAYLSVPALLGPVLGPPLGGFLATYTSWRWIFMLNVPIGVLGFILVSLFIENVKASERAPLDIVGLALSGICLANLIFGFELAGREGVPLWVAVALLALGIAAGAAYLRHAAGRQHPALDLLLFRIPSFAITVSGGMFFRIGVGALPFLLPLMLRLGFGLTPFASGLITFAGAAGALLMKTTARPILRRWGFRTVLLGNAVLSSAFLLACAAFRPETPQWAILAVLLVGGFFRSLEFTALNALAFADVPPPRMSQASISTTAQQLAMSLGVALGATLLQATRSWRGVETLGPGDFWPAFVAVAVVSVGSAPFFARLTREAGAEMSGHIPRRVAPATGD